MFGLRFKAVQAPIAQFIVNSYFNECDVEIEVNYLETDFYHFIDLKELNLKDTKGLNLFHVNNLRLEFKSFLNFNVNHSLEKVEFINPSLNIRIYRGDSTSNFSQWLNCFPETDTLGLLSFSLFKTEISRGQFSFLDENKINNKLSESMNDTRFDNINVNLELIEFINDSILIDLKYISFTEKTGLQLESFKRNKLNFNSDYFSPQLFQLDSIKSMLNFTNLHFKQRTHQENNQD